MTARPRPRTRSRHLPDHAPTPAEAEHDAAVDRGEADDYYDQLRDGLAGWGQSA